MDFLIASYEQNVGINLEKMDIALDKLIDSYKTKKICLFTGAGISFTSTNKYKTPGWWKLLELIYDARHHQFSNEQKWKSFAEIKEQSSDAWKVVDTFIDLFGSPDKFQQLLIDSLISETANDKKYKRLPISYINNSPTLNSVIAFCSKIKYYNVHQCLTPNNKIQAVLTLNYDWYFEGGATQKYNKRLPFKPMIDKNSSYSNHQLPVYHLHGYIPHNNKSVLRKPLTMSTKTYDELYAKKNSWVKAIIKDYLSSYSTLFIGISFDDTLLVDYLQQLAKSQDWPLHFFLAKRETFSTSKLKVLEKANIYPIWVKDYDEIPNILMKVYTEGMDRNDLKVWYRKKNTFKTLEFEHYWKLLSINKP